MVYTDEQKSMFLHNNEENVEKWPVISPSFVQGNQMMLLINNYTSCETSLLKEAMLKKKFSLVDSFIEIEGLFIYL